MNHEQVIPRDTSNPLPASVVASQAVRADTRRPTRRAASTSISNPAPQEAEAASDNKRSAGLSKERAAAQARNKFEMLEEERLLKNQLAEFWEDF